MGKKSGESRVFLPGKIFEKIFLKTCNFSVFIPSISTAGQIKDTAGKAGAQANAKTSGRAKPYPAPGAAERKSYTFM